MPMIESNSQTSRHFEVTEVRLSLPAELAAPTIPQRIQTAFLGLGAY